MHNDTKKKLEALKAHIQKYYPTWHKRYPNLLGAYPGEKEKDGKCTGRYSIVFLVSDKKDKPSKPIPKYFDIKLKGIGKTRIPTDVIESGKLKLRKANLSDKIKLKKKNDFGTTGMFIVKNSQVFACTNAHVLLPDMIDDKQTHFLKPAGTQIVPDVTLISANGDKFDAHLQEGFFGGIDAAIARMDNPADVGNTVPGSGRPAGKKTIKAGDEGMQLTMRGFITKISAGKITKVGLTVPTSIPNVFIDNLIDTDIFSEGGDSGSPVFDGARRLIGIIMGGLSPTTTLIVPIDKILDAFKCDLLL